MLQRARILRLTALAGALVAPGASVLGQDAEQGVREGAGQGLVRLVQPDARQDALRRPPVIVRAPVAPNASTSRVFPDESVTASEAMVRVRELAEAENHGEAARVLQRTIASEGDRVLRSAEHPEVCESVRERAHAMLRASPALLERYRADLSPVAQELLDGGDVERVEREMLYTPAGFDAALRLSQLQLLRARFHAARLILESLEAHPDRTGERAASAAEAMGQLCAYIDEAQTRAIAERWAREAGVAARIAPRAEPPARARVHATDPTSPQDAPTWDDAPKDPLQSIVFQEVSSDEQNLVRRHAANVTFGLSVRSPWIMPTAYGQQVLLNDGAGFSAFDGATLALMWRTTPPVSAIRRGAGFNYGYNQVRAAEDVGGVAASRGVAVGVTGQPVGNGRFGDSRVHALRVEDGSLLWSLEPSFIAPELQTGSVRGVPVIDADTVVVGVRKVVPTRRTVSLSMVGLDLYTGQARWIRQAGAVGAQPYGVVASRPEGNTLSRGVVYRADDMGLLGAWEAQTGRPRWVRLLRPGDVSPDGGAMQAIDVAPAHAAHEPVVAWTSKGERVYAIEPSTGAVLELDARTGVETARRGASETGDPGSAQGPIYLVRVGEHVACVARFGVVFLALEGFGEAKPTRVDGLGEGGLVARATALGDQLAAPLSQRVVTIDPVRGIVGEHALERVGNLLVVPEGSLGAVVSADEKGLHSYLTWEVVKAGLERRMREAPKDPAPVLTFVELALRMQRAEIAPTLADRALALIGALGGEGEESARRQASRARTRLFALLHGVLREARVGQGAPEAEASGGAATDGVAQVVTQPSARATPDLALLEAIESRLSLAAEEPWERVLSLIERAHLRESARKPAQAVDALQEVLLDDDLARVGPPGAAELGFVSQARTSGELVGSLLQGVLEREGFANYAPYEEECARLAAGLPEGAPVREWEALAARYPASIASSRAWRQAAALHRAAGDGGRARAALGLGVRGAVLAARTGRPDAIVPLGEALSELVGAPGGSPSDNHAFQRLLLDVDERFGGVVVRLAGADMTAAQAAAELSRLDAARRVRPTVGQEVSGDVQVIAGMEALEPLARARAGQSLDAVVMASRTGERVELWARSPFDGRLSLAWSRVSPRPPSVLRVTPSDTLVMWTSGEGPRVEAIANTDGRTRWITPTLGELLPERAVRSPEQIRTPLDGVVRADDVLLALREDELALAERGGRLALLDVLSGRVRWSASTDLQGVYDLEQGADATYAVGVLGDGTPAVIALDPASGKELWRAARPLLGDHARWVKSLKTGGVLVGTADGLVRLTREGSVAWTSFSGALRHSAGAWLLAGEDGADASAIVMDGDFALWRVEMSGGKVDRAPIDAQNRITLPFRAEVLGDRLALASATGLVVIGEAGEVIGMDALEPSGRLSAPDACEGGFVTIEGAERMPAGLASPTSPARILRLGEDGRLLREQAIELLDEPTSVLLLDGKILVGQGSSTLVYDAPAR
jgi:outer membrane protein assembly factor BamB